MTTQTKTTWRKVKLREVAGVLGGFAFKSEWFNTQKIGFPAVKIQNITDGLVDVASAEYVDITKVKRDISKFRLHKGDFLVAMTGATAGKVGLLIKETPCYLNQRVGKFYPKNEGVLDKKFLYYSVINPRNLNLLKKLADGSAQGNMSSSQIEDVLEILIPDGFTDQKRIADILSAFDDKIELNNKISRTLEQMAQAIFKEWFVNFRFPGHEKVKMVDSELGKIPEGWEVKKIKDVAKIQKGLSYTSSEISEKPIGVPMLNLANFLRGGGFNPSGIKYFSGRYKETDLVQNGDIIIAMTDLTSNREVIGHPARVPSYSHWGKILISLDVSVIKTENALRGFFYYLMMRKDFAFRMASSAGGTNIAHLSKSTIENYSFVLPSRNLLEQFHDFVNPAVTSKNKKEVENQKLATLRDLLLPKLMSGEIRV